MLRQLYTNNASSTLASGLSSVSTLIYVPAGKGALFGDTSAGNGGWQMLTLTDGVLLEIVRLDVRTGDMLQVLRAQEGTTARPWAAGSTVEARLTAGMLNRLAENAGTGTGSLAVSPDGGAQATGYGATALGFNSYALGDSSAAIGYLAQAKAQQSIALAGAAAWRPRQFSMGAHACVPRDDWAAGYGSHGNSGAESVWASRYLELGTPQTWVAGATYTDGDVVQPTVPNGCQYTLWHGSYDTTVTNTIVSGVTEPTWPTGVGSDVAEGGAHSWITATPTAGDDEVIPAFMTFYPTEVGFICFNHSGVTAAPFVSIGTVADPTLLVNNQQLTSITGANQRHVFTGLKHGISDLRVKLVTAATGGSARFHGRFYAKGIFIQTQG